MNAALGTSEFGEYLTRGGVLSGIVQTGQRDLKSGPLDIAIRIFDRIDHLDTDRRLVCEIGKEAAAVST